MKVANLNHALRTAELLIKLNENNSISSEELRQYFKKSMKAHTLDV